LRIKDKDWLIKEEEKKLLMNLVNTGKDASLTSSKSSNLKSFLNSMESMLNDADLSLNELRLIVPDPSCFFCSVLFLY
jgi:hypothetical protein